MTDDTKMSFARIEHVIKSAPQILPNWFKSKQLDARIFFSAFKKAPEEDVDEKQSERKTSKTEEALWTDSEEIHGATPLHLAVGVHKGTSCLLEDILKLIKEDEQNRYLTSAYKLSPSNDYSWEVRDKDGFTPISLAIKNNNANAVAMLAEAGCRIDTRCDVSWSFDEDKKKSVITNLIGISIVFDAMECFMTLLELGVNPLECDSKGRLPVHVAIEYDRLDAVQKLIELMEDSDKAKQIDDTYLVREDFEGFATDEIDLSEEAMSNENDSSSPNIILAGSGENDGGHEDTLDLQNSDAASADPLSELWGAGSMGSADPDEEEDEEDMFTLEDILQLEREMIEAGFEVQRDRAGNITARFRGREGGTHIQPGRIDNDYGSNLLHLAVKYHKHDVCHFLLTAAQKLQDVEDKRDDGMTAMHIAAKNNDTRMMQLLAEEAGAQVNPCNDVLGMYPIHIACENGAAEALKFLLVHGVDANCRDDNGFVPLHYAATSEQSSECIDILLEARADVNAVSLDKETPLYTAVSRWNMEQFWKILKAGGDPSIAHCDSTVVLGFLAANSMEELGKFAAYISEHSQVQDSCDLDIVIGDEGQTALHIAARNQSVKVLENLLKAGANPNIEDESGLSPLLTVMENANGDKVEISTSMNLLLRAGADPNKTTPDGERLLHFACKAKFHQLVEQLLKSGAEKDATSKSETALHVSAVAEDIHAMKMLLHAGADPNVLNEEKFTPLLICAKNHFVDGVQLLVDHGADVNISSPEGNTCLHVCADLKKGKTREVISKLTKAGASLDAFNTVGDQPLHVHISEYRTDGTRSLIEAGADINCLSKSGRTPLMTACDRGHLEAVRMLLRAGANVNMENKNKHTAMYYFANSESKTVRALRLLLNAGANISHKDKDGDTVLHEAALNDHPAVIRFLLHRGIDINACNRSHETPLFQAATNGFIEATEALLRNYPTIRPANPRICNNSGNSPYEAARAGGHTEIMQILLQAMKVTLSTFAPLSVYSRGLRDSSGMLGSDKTPASSDSTICAVCQEVLEVGDQIRKLPCGHEFHDPCILPWIGGEQMSQNMDCPVCKQPIAPKTL
ncbi:Ankyrin-3 [Gracilariopsis chorda]|uniref:Ankyrin-3 n=1 Tax=Gracilariopsis chorda TaxID=448386 RepID=A0A2V3IJ13_9FLOR|nr:Ankyrin-3 [Gracilariopsis chorda]|eukprot:PXF42086.1 Ankyrin-3 [Gracilariopsis chorda]